MAGAAGLSDDVVRGAAEGTRSDLERIMEAMEPQVRLMVAARLGPSPDQWSAIDDLTQQVLLGLTTGVSRLKERTVGGLKAFTSSIVRRRVIDRLRRSGRGGGPSPRSLDSTVNSLTRAGPLWQFLAGAGSTPRTEVMRAEQAELLLTELGSLKQEHREVITMAFFDQLPTAEIARELDISRPAASMLLIRAVRALRRRMRISSTCG